MARKNYRRKDSSTKKEMDSKKEVSSVNKPETSSPETKDVSVNTKDGIPSAANDPEWYARDTRLLDDGARIPFNLPFGSKIRWFNTRAEVHFADDIIHLADNYQDRAVPGVCTLRLKPSLGTNLYKSSPANVCANALYTHVRYVNSGRKNYDPADLFMYTMAFGDIYSFVVYLIRLYNYAYMYSQRNYYMGATLIRACGADPDYIVQHLADFRYWINSIINKISSFAVPADIYYFKRRVFLYSNYYCENPVGNIKDQLYQLCPQGFYSFQYDAENGSGFMQYTDLEEWMYTTRNNKVWGNYTWEDFAAYFEQVLMGNITGDEDFGLMSGDILKAYGTNIIMLASIPEEGGILPVFDPYVLSQIKNAHVDNSIYRHSLMSADTEFVYKGETFTYGDVKQSTDGLIISAESAPFGSPMRDETVFDTIYAQMQKLLTVENPDPGVGDVVEATRLLPGVGSQPITAEGESGETLCYFGGTELVLGVELSLLPDNNVRISWTQDPINATYTALTTSGVLNDRNNQASGLGRVISRWFGQFKYMPLMYYVDCAKTQNEYTLYDVVPMSNVDNTTLVSDENLKRVHEIALLSLFYVPGVAKLIS